MIYHINQSTLLKLLLLTCTTILMVQLSQGFPQFTTITKVPRVIHFGPGNPVTSSPVLSSSPSTGINFKPQLTSFTFRPSVSRRRRNFFKCDSLQTEEVLGVKPDDAFSKCCKSFPPQTFSYEGKICNKCDQRNGKPPPACCFCTTITNYALTSNIQVDKTQPPSDEVTDYYED